LATNADVKPCVGVLFVHGAGDHGIGATLVEFGEPLIAWLDGWLRQGVPSPSIATDRARAGGTQIIVREGDANAPAHSVVRLRSQLAPEEHTWLLAEARWDQAFTPPGFQQVLLWSIGVVPWTVLTQFIGPLARQARFVESDPLSVAAYLLRVVAAAATALIASAVVLTIALLILILSLIPIDAVRSVVSRLQRFASTGVGDLYLVLTSPIQGAALSSAVQRDIDWMRKQGCKRVAVIAHSQGGYVAYQALTDPWRRAVDLFVTFGSGVIRLTESERARRTPALVLALIGTVGALVAIRFFPIAILGEAGLVAKRQADGLAFAVGAVVSLLLIVVLWRYFHAEAGVADVPEKPPWYDFLTTDDPVVNRRRDGLLPPRVEQIRTQNRGSVLADHGSYWQNGDQFVPQVAEQLGRLDVGLNLMVAGPKATPSDTKTLLDKAYQRRRGRVSALRRRTNAVIVTTLVVLGVLVLRGGQLEAIGRPVGQWLGSLPSFLTSWVPDVIRSVLPIDGIETLVLGAIVIVVLAFLATSVGSRFWDRWSLFDTMNEYRGTSSEKPSAAAVGFYAWTFLQLLVLVLLAVIGPAAIVTWLGKIADDRNPIVQAWAREYIWTLLVGLVAFLWASSPGRSAGGSPRIRVIGGVALALSVELIVAILAPGATPASTAIPAGIIAGILAVAIAWFVWPSLQSIVEAVAIRVEDDSDQKPEAKDPASVIDYVGFVGLLIAVLAAYLAFGFPIDRIAVPLHLWRFTTALALAGLACGLVLAVNSDGIKRPANGWLARLLGRVPLLGNAWGALARMTEGGSPMQMRLAGVVAMVLSGWTVVVAVGRVIASGGPFD
jgi:hypothetical protein